MTNSWALLPKTTVGLQPLHPLKPDPISKRLEGPTDEHSSR
jgi:hypothetical protein